MCARSIYHIHICFYIYMYTCTCVYVLARRQNIFCMHASECGQAMCACVWVREGECVWCSVLYASEPLPAGIRKVDLGHKYLISVCCPWKSSIYSQPNGKMPLSDPLPFSSRQKEMQRWEAVRGTLTWYGWSRTEATPEKKKQCSSAADEKSSPGSYRWTAFTKPLIVCLVWKELWYDTTKNLSQTAKYWILCVWYCQTE